MPEISARTWSRFVVTNFYVATEVMGSEHEFDFRGFSVYIKLPSQDQANRDERYDKVASLSSWRADTEEPLSYTIQKIDVEIEVKKRTECAERSSRKAPETIRVFL